VAKQATALRYAVRFRVVFKYFGQLCIVLATLSLAFYYRMLKKKRRVAVDFPSVPM
jgi:hypothetical protein